MDTACQADDHRDPGTEGPTHTFVDERSRKDIGWRPAALLTTPSRTIRGSLPGPTSAIDAYLQER